MTDRLSAVRGAAVATLLIAATPAVAATYGGGTVALGAGTYGQNFDTLATTGTSSTLPSGWIVVEDGTNANGTYAAGTGSSNAGDVYSFGAAASTDRALGALRSGSLLPTIGAVFSNGTGAAINGLEIAYAGEQWRNGSASIDALNFQYSLTSTDISLAANDSAWISFAGLDFSAPNNAAGPALDGNAAANRTLINATIANLTIAQGATFAFRWLDADPTGADDGLAIDDFSLRAVPAVAAVPEPATWAMMIGGFGVLGGVLRRRAAVRLSHAL